MEDPTRLEQEYRQRLLVKENSTELDFAETSLDRLRQGIARLIDSYAEGMIDKAEFEPGRGWLSWGLPETRPLTQPMAPETSDGFAKAERRLRSSQLRWSPDGTSLWLLAGGAN